MSNEAINWALTRPIKHSTAKFVLVVMANCADSQDWLAWPSIAHLSESTGQDRKTVIANIKRLIEMGYIKDTGQRKGNTKQVPIYRLNDTENGTVNAVDNSHEEDQKRDSLNNETVPIFPSNSTVFPHKESQNSLETVPKTGHGTTRTLKEPSRNPNSKPAPDLPDGFEEAWRAYPKRPGASKADSLKAWQARINAGAEPGEILAGVLRYATYVKACGTVSTYIKQPSTFFGPGGHFKSDWTAPQQARASPQQNARFNFAGADRSGDQAAMAASMKRMGVEIPDGDIEFN